MTLDVVDVCNLLRLACRQAGGARAWARQHGISEQYVSDVLNARRDPGESILRPLGLVRIVRYARAVRLGAGSGDLRSARETA
jgi:hypothetical protein